MHCNKHVHVFHVDRRGKDKQIAEKFKWLPREAKRH